MAILYRHIRLDKNEVFYIGIGKKQERAEDTYHRNKHWKSITSKSKYEIEILFDDISWEDACKKEKEFIKLYGRRDLNTGTLVNLTDGGEGMIGVKMKPRTEEHCNNISKSKKGTIPWNKGIKVEASEEHKQRCRIQGLGKVRSQKSKILYSISKIGSNNPNSKIVLDTSTGIFYNTVKEAAISKNMNRHTLSDYLRGKLNNKTSLIYA